MMKWLRDHGARGTVMKLLTLLLRAGVAVLATSVRERNVKLEQ